MRKLAVALAAAALVTLALVAALLRGPGPSAANASSQRKHGAHVTHRVTVVGTGVRGVRMRPLSRSVKSNAPAEQPR